LRLTMSFHPESLKLEGEAYKLNKTAIDKAVILYEGELRS